VLELPSILLLYQLFAHQQEDGSVVGDDLDHYGLVFHFLA